MLSGPDGTRATSGQRSALIGVLDSRAISTVTAARPFPSRRPSGRGTTGTRRSHSVMPWTRMPNEPISGASGAANCSRTYLTDAGSPPGAAHRRDECGLVLPVQRNRHVEFGIRPRRPHQVVAVDVVERRHIELLRHHRGLAGVRRQQVGVPAAVGVVHFGDHVAQHAVGVVAPVQAQRVEHVAEHPGLQQRGDGAAAQVDAVVGEEVVDALPQCVVRRAVEVVAWPRSGRTAAAIAATPAAGRCRHTSCSFGVRSSGAPERGADA